MTLSAPGSYIHAASAPVMKSKTLFNLEGNYRQPSDVVAGTNDRVYVLDGVNNRVKVHAGSGQHLFSFGTTGTGNGEFNFPLGIGIDETNRIYVADSGNHRIQIFSPEGVFLANLSTETDPNQIKPSDPTDVAPYLPLKRCYVVDNDNHRVIIYNLETMKPLKSQGIMGLGKKEFRFPFLLDIDSEGNLYVVEVINTRVKVLDPDGNYMISIGEWGVEPGCFYRPKGVAIDPSGRVFVSDSYLGVIQAFDREGRFLFVLGDEKGNVKKFKAPTGIFIDKTNKLYVAEMLADRVQVIQLPN
jgi:DNA-binding beta-propeller fold protein YncE